jgi:gas vesicle protein
MALTQFTDAAGRTAWKDDSGKVFTEGGTRDTYYTVDQWNTRQKEKYGSGSSSSKSSSSSSSKSSSSPSIDYNKIIEENIKRMQEANAPVIQSLQSSIPETQQKFATERTRLQGEVEPLKARYDNLLSKIKGQETTATNRQTVATQNELGRRGIVGGGLAEQTLVDALNPITSEYAGLTTDASLGMEADLRAIQNAITGLTGQETEATRSIQNAIAQLQAGANQSGVQNALDISTLLQGQRQFDTQESRLNRQADLLERNFNEATLPQIQYALNKPYYQPDTTNPLLQELQNLAIEEYRRKMGLNNAPNNTPNFSTAGGQQTYVPNSWQEGW